MSRPSPEEVIARIADWRGKDVRWEELGGGITNHNYVVWVDGGPENGGAKYVMRVPGVGTDMFIDRDAECDCLIQAARVGVAPRVAYQLDPEGALVMAFVEGEVMHPQAMAGHPERIRQAVETVRGFHGKAVFKHEIDVFQMLSGYTKIAWDIGAPLPDRLKPMLRLMDDVEEAMGRHPVNHVACHNDLLSENFIVDGDDKMWVIDWEYGGMNDPYFDLGDFVMEHPFSRGEERLVIATYCGEMSDRSFGRMMLYKTVSAVWWAVWAMIQHAVSGIDFDYTEWGMERVGRAEACLSDPDFDKWLADV